MAVNTTEYSQVEDAIQTALRAALAYNNDSAIRVYNGDMDLTGRSTIEWAKLGPPCIVIAIENISDELLTEEGGRHPRSYWETLDIGLYLYDKSLRSRQETMRGKSGVAAAPGIWKMFEDVRDTLTGLDLTSGGTTLGWEGPVWNEFRPIAQEIGEQLWRQGVTYMGAVKYPIDTSTLDTLASIHGDFNVQPTTTFDPDLEKDIT
jgi:hypothetical protein